ncbi:hypothetical protein H0484_04805 [Pusillimonas sp. CC-YST705]|uniref:NfeD-like C-terminal domain-containing protein n=1 Tax=Mesopusillimonas faecipullorum TaxID=2755040 RepID=A0ABS8CAK8_9BURK|nr:NfeD family protein [Mesopusillimonas faecipullorum]MCB5363074.1 hypothetical protein [Mesopusillimonas faecipullorum]
MIDPAVFDSASLMPMHWAAMALVMAGLFLLFVEAALPSFGAIGATGVIAFTVGGILLMKADIPGLVINPSYLALASLTGVIIVVALVILAIRSQRKRVVSGKEGLKGQRGEVISVEPGAIYARVQGEMWLVSSKHPLKPGDSVRVSSIEGLTLHVERLTSSIGA